MEIRSTIDATAKALATLTEDGQVALKLVCASPYRVTPEGEDLTASVTIEVTDPALLAPIRDALGRALAQAADLAGPALAQAIHTARSVAYARGEMGDGR